MYESPSVCFAQSPLRGWLRVRTQGLTVADGVTSPKTRCPWGWTEGGPGRTTGQPRYAGLGLAPSPFVVGLTPTYAGTNLGCHSRECPSAGSRLLRGYGERHRPGRAQPSTRLPLPLAGSRRARLPPPPPPSPSFRGAAGRGGWGCWAGSFAALWLFASAAPAKQPRERAPWARSRALHPRRRSRDPANSGTE